MINLSFEIYFTLWKCCDLGQIRIHDVRDSKKHQCTQTWAVIPRLISSVNLIGSEISKARLAWIFHGGEFICCTCIFIRSSADNAGGGGGGGEEKIVESRQSRGLT